MKPSDLWEFRRGVKRWFGLWCTGCDSTGRFELSFIPVWVDVWGLIRDMGLFSRLGRRGDRVSEGQFEDLTTAAIHDFKNIFANIVGHLELARQDLGETGAPLEHVEAAGRVADFAQDVAARLLSSRSGDEAATPLSFSRIARTAGDLVLNHAYHDLVLAVYPNARKVAISPIRAMQIMTNLIANAAQVMPEGGRIFVRILPVREGGVPGSATLYTRLEVEDEGPGIPANLRERIFESGVSDREGGHGIGLPVVKEHVERAGGQIRVMDGEIGALFQLDFPADEAAERATQPELQIPVMPVAGAALSVLVMDDDPMVRETTGAMLRHLGHDVRFAAEGLSCVRSYRDAANKGQKFDLVIVDLTVPGGWDGVKTLKELRAMDPGVPVIVTSGMTHDPVMHAFAEKGFTAAIRKPFTLHQLATVLGTVGEEGSDEVDGGD